LFAGQELADAVFAVNGESSLEILVSPEGASITGDVVDGEGQPVPNAFVATVPSSGELGRPDAYQSARTDATGKFVIRGMNPGDFVVIALETPQQDRTFRCTASPQRLHGSAF
jgi:Carboxypeptidase regulatory-like domain